MVFSDILISSNSPYSVNQNMASVFMITVRRKSKRELRNVYLFLARLADGGGGFGTICDEGPHAA
jgi:hypothetical protein